MGNLIQQKDSRTEKISHDESMYWLEMYLELDNFLNQQNLLIVYLRNSDFAADK